MKSRKSTFSKDKENSDKYSNVLHKDNVINNIIKIVFKYKEPKM